MEKFRISEKGKGIYKYACTYIINDIPKVHTIYKTELNKYILEMNENILRANLNIGSIRSKYQKEVLVNISMVDMLLSILREKSLVNKNKFMTFGNMLLEIRKMVIGWQDEKSE